MLPFVKYVSALEPLPVNKTQLSRSITFDRPKRPKIPALKVVSMLLSSVCPVLVLVMFAKFTPPCIYNWALAFISIAKANAVIKIFFIVLGLVF